MDEYNPCFHSQPYLSILYNNNFTLKIQTVSFKKKMLVSEFDLNA